MSAHPISLRLDDATAARIDRLIAAGVARDRTDAIRRGVAALDDALASGVSLASLLTSAAMPGIDRCRYSPPTERTKP